MNKQTSPQHRAEPNEATLKFWRDEENLHRTHGVKPAILPGQGRRRLPSIMAAPEPVAAPESEVEAA